MVAGYHKQIILTIPTEVILHVCGDVTLIAEEMVGTGVTALSLDPKADIKQMRAKVGGKIPFLGGVNTTFLSLCDPEEIKAVSLKALKEGMDILAPGCAIPANTSTGNLQAMVQAVEEFESIS